MGRREGFAWSVYGEAIKARKQGLGLHLCFSSSRKTPTAAGGRAQTSRPVALERAAGLSQRQGDRFTHFQGPVLRGNPVSVPYIDESSKCSKSLQFMHQVVKY